MPFNCDEPQPHCDTTVFYELKTISMLNQQQNVERKSCGTYFCIDLRKNTTTKAQKTTCCREFKIPKPNDFDFVSFSLRRSWPKWPGWLVFTDFPKEKKVC